MSTHNESSGAATGFEYSKKNVRKIEGDGYWPQNKLTMKIKLNIVHNHLEDIK